MSKGFKVTTTAERAKYLREQIERVQQLNATCPECGHEDNNPFRYLISRTWASGIFKTKHWMQYSLFCEKCGCEWESEAFEWA